MSTLPFVKKKKKSSTNWNVRMSYITAPFPTMTRGKEGLRYFLTEKCSARVVLVIEVDNGKKKTEKL